MLTTGTRAAAQLLAVCTLLIAVVVALVAPAAPRALAASSTVVISQVYGGGGNSGATFTNDFVELFNLSASPVSIAGWSVQYASSSGTTWQVTSLSGTIPAGGYYLVQQAQGSGGTQSLPTPDAIGTIVMSASSGKVALVNSTVALTGSGCPIGAPVVDFVGYGSANCFEGSAAPTLTNTTAALRADNGCTETGNNGADLAAGTPNPRNSASPTASCAIADPAITRQPPSPTVVAGEVVTLDVVAVGTTPLSYQWYEGTAPDTTTPVGTNSAIFTTPPLSATTSYWVRVSNGLGSVDSATATIAVGAACAATDTPIGQIQGTGSASPIVGTPVTVQGVVVGDYEEPFGGSQIRGFYLQDGGDGNPATSDGIFVYTNGTNRVSLGEVVQVNGTISEIQNQTQLSGVLVIESCGTTGSVTPVDVTLPLPDADYLERFEGMLVRFPQTLYVTEHFQLGRFGQVVLSSGDRLYQPTSVETPGAQAITRQAANDLNRIILDDDNNQQNPDPIVYGRGQQPLSAGNTLRGGDSVASLTGVLVYSWAGNSASGNAYRVRAVGDLDPAIPTFVAANRRPTAAPWVGGLLKVSAYNVLNYFLTLDTTSGSGPCGPAGTLECRGAETTEEFQRQRAKLLQALRGLNADVLGLIELENTTGVDPVGDLVAGLNGLTAPGTFAAIDTGTIGTDAIKVGLIYKPAAVTPVGAFEILDSADDPRFLDNRNRPVLAQTFRENATGETFTVAVAHLKSKGSACSGDPDTGDGQGNCNLTRTAAAEVLVDWLDATFDDPDFLILGDLNAYAREDPITAILAGPDDTAGTSDDYTNLIERFGGAEAYSYVFGGQWGYLDHALASAGLASRVTGAAEWHINADEPNVLDYNTNFKSAGQIAGLYAADQFRTSDHDPVLIGLTLDPAKAPVRPEAYLPLVVR